MLYVLCVCSRARLSCAVVDVVLSVVVLCSVPAVERDCRAPAIGRLLFLFLLLFRLELGQRQGLWIWPGLGGGGLGPAFGSGLETRLLLMLLDRLLCCVSAVGRGCRTVVVVL